MNAKTKEGWIWSLWSQVRHKNPRRMRVLETLSLGGKRSLCLVECGGKLFFAGCGADAVNCILPVPFVPSGTEEMHCGQTGEELVAQCCL